MTTTTRPAPPAVEKATRRDLVPLLLVALVVAIIAELIGKHTIPVGPASISIYPMVWGLLIGAIVSIQPVVRIPVKIQRTANALMGLFVLILCARLAFNIGPALEAILSAGPALLLQELGHLFGTVVLALPLAVLLRMGPATVGATFSLDREPAFAMVNDRYGPDSDQYRGVLAMYVFGTLFGAVIISFLTSFIASLDVFSPLALAMGVGVGSGSMMAAGVASITDLYPAQAEAVQGMAAVSNLITSLAGVYVGMYVALPLADKLYHLLTGGRHRKPAADAGVNREFRESVSANFAPVHVPLWVAMGAVSVIGLITASIVARGLSLNLVIGYLIMDVLVLVALALARLTRVISALIWVTTIGAFLSSPWSPVAEQVTAWVGSVDFLSIATVVLVMAGLSLGKDVPLLRTIGWKIIPVGLVAVIASFLGASVIAEFTLGLWG